MIFNFPANKGVAPLIWFLGLFFNQNAAKGSFVCRSGAFF